jgi:hypothetical protein
MSSPTARHGSDFTWVSQQSGPVVFTVRLTAWRYYRGGGEGVMERKEDDGQRIDLPPCPLSCSNSGINFLRAAAPFLISIRNA